MTTTRRLLLTVVLPACVAAAPPGGWLNPGTDTQAQMVPPSPAGGFRVAIICDRTGGQDSGLAVLERAVGEINLLQPDFVMHIGDIVPGYIRDMAQWEADVTRAKAILGRLEAPVYPLTGNHDVITGTGDTNDRRGEDIYKRYFGPLYYSFSYRDAHFICLYTDEQLRSRPRLSRAQLEWLRDDLKAAAPRQVFVFMHKPLWDYEDSGWEQVHDLLRRHRVRAVFAAHYHHYYKADLRDGIQYYVLGVTGGRLFSPELAGGLEHYCILHVRPDGYRLALVKPGQILPDDYVQLADFKALEKLRFLPESETGVTGPVVSPEGGRMEGQVPIRVRNPLDRPLDVTVRGLSRDAGWEFPGEPLTGTVAPGAVLNMSLPIRHSQLSTEGFVPPDVEVTYYYVDAQGRPVEIPLRRRVPVLRRATAAPAGAALVVDGRMDEPSWATAQPLAMSVWQAGAYETGQPEPVIRLLAGTDGLYVGIQARDTYVSDFRGAQVLCDAVFVGAARPDSTGHPPPVVALFPFGNRPQAVRAPWDARRVAGPDAGGVLVAAKVSEEARTWTCEALVPWQALLGTSRPTSPVRFNAGVWDNDGDLFTEFHSWAPMAETALWGTLQVATP